MRGRVHRDLGEPGLMLVGVGNGTAIPVLFGTVLGRITPSRAGTASGVLTTAQQFASAAGVTGLGSVFFALLGAGHGVTAYAQAMEWVLGLSLVLTLMGALVVHTLATPSRPSRPSGEETSGLPHQPRRSVHQVSMVPNFRSKSRS